MNGCLLSARDGVPLSFALARPSGGKFMSENGWLIHLAQQSKQGLDVTHGLLNHSTLAGLESGMSDYPFRATKQGPRLTVDRLPAGQIDSAAMSSSLGSLATVFYAILVILLADPSVSRREHWHHSHPIPDSGPDAEVIRVRELGPLKFRRTISGRDVGYSARFGDRSVWVFGDTILNSRAADGSRWRSSTWCWTSDFDARNGLSFNEPVDQRGAPGEFLPFTEEESAHNANHNREALPDDQRSRWALWPGPVVADLKTRKAYVFYSKVISRVGPWAFKNVGRSIAVWDEPN